MSATLHVVYYEPAKRSLIEECLVPLAFDVSAQKVGGEVFLERHWRLGPQVRLCIPGDLGRDRVEDLRARIAEHLAAKPSRAHLDAPAYVESSRRLGVAELEPPPYEPLWPDNSVVVAPYAPRADLLGAGVVLKERFLHRALPIVREVFAARRAGDRRVELTVALLAVVANSWPLGDLGWGAFSYRSHCEDFLNDFDPQGRVRAAFQRTFAGGADGWLGAVSAAAAGTGAGPGSDPILLAWRDLVGWFWTEAAPLAERRHIVETPVARFRPVAGRVGAEAGARWRRDASALSEFHQEMNRNLPAVDTLRGTGTATYAVYRWLTSLTYLVLPLFDVSPLERSLAAYLVAESADRLTGMDWQSRLVRMYDAV